MLSAERRELILRELALRGSLRVEDFAAKFGFSGMTIRRDLAALADEGLLERVHGGAVPLSISSSTDGKSAWQTRGPIAVIGMVVPSASYYFPGIIKGAEAAAQASGVRLVLGVSGYSAEEESRQVQRLLKNGVQGLLVTPSAESLAGQPVTGLLAAAKVPVIIVERSIEEVLDTVSGLEAVRSDHVQGAEVAISHLINNGHRKIALFTRQHSPTATALRLGFQRAMSRYGVPVDDELLREIAHPADRSGSVEESFQALVRLCQRRSATAALVHNDEDAIEFSNLIREHGLAVPEDFSIIAYDDEIAALGEVALTAVSPPKFDVGFHALSMCFNRIRNRPSSAVGALQRLSLSAVLTTRESTGPVKS